MRSKIALLFLFITLISVVCVSAATTFTLSKSTLDFVEPETSSTFTITPDALSSYTTDIPEIKDENDQIIPISIVGDLTDIDSTQTITVNTTPDYDELDFGKVYSGNLVIKNSSDPDENETVTLNFLNTFCKDGEIKMIDKELAITDVKIDNDDGDDLEWSPLDDITVEVEVNNEGDEKIKDIIVELGIYDSEGKDLAKDLDDLDDEQIDLGSLKDDKDDTVTFTFKVPADFDPDDYKLVIKAFSDDEGEKDLCTSEYDDYDSNNRYYEVVEVDRESDEEKHIVVDNIRLSPATAQCGERVQISVEVFNIGDQDYEDQVKVTLQNQELGLDLEQVVREDFDEGDSSVVDFEFDVPEDADEKTYTLEFRTYYDYNDRHDVYEIMSDEKFINVDEIFKVEGGCREIIPPDDEIQSARITAELDSETPEAIPGKQVIINANLRNTGTLETTYVVSVFGNSAWSSLVSVEPQTMTLAPGEARNIDIVLSIDDDAGGEKELTIKASYGDKATEQRVALTVGGEEDQSQEVANHLKENWFIYLIVLVNLILIIAIILVVRRMVTPRQPL